MSFQMKNVLIFLKVGLFEAPAFKFRMHEGQILFSCSGYNRRYACPL